MRIVTDTQRSEEWYQARLGCITASEAISVISKPRNKKDKFSAMQKSYINRLVSEVLTGKSYDNFTNYDMEWGIKYEPIALEAYNDETGFNAVPVGMALHDDYEKVGASVDALAPDRTVEIKCSRKGERHVSRILGNIEMKERAQMQFQMWVCGMYLCDLVAYHPDFPVRQKLVIKTFERDEYMIDLFRENVPKMLQEVDEILDRLMADED